MNAAQKRSWILAQARANGTVTKQECVDKLGCYYYHNGQKYVGEILSRLVKSNLLIRIKPGVFELRKKPSPCSLYQDNE